MSNRLLQRLEDAAENAQSQAMKKLLSDAGGEIEYLRDRCANLEDELARTEEALEDARRDDE